MPNVAQTYDASNLRNHSLNTAVGLTIIQDTNIPKAVYRYDNPNTVGTTKGHGTFIVAPNYQGGNVVVRVQYRESNNSGSLTGTQLNGCVVKDGDALTAGTTLNLSAASVTVPGTAGNIGELVYTFTTGFTAGTMHFVPFFIARQTTDTAGGLLDILSFEVEYAVDITFTKQYAWIPSSVWQSIGGVATLGAPTNGVGGSADRFPYTYQFPDVAGGKIGLKYTLPSTYTGNLKYYLVGWDNTASNTLTMGMAMGEAAVGGNFDPTLTRVAQNYTISGAPVHFIIGNAGAGIAAPISPAANSTLSMQVDRDNTDSNTGIFNVFGVILEYDVFTASPSPVIQFNPTSLAPPTSNAASILAINDTNNSGYLVRFTQGVVNKIAGKRQNPGTYSAGGTFVGFVKTPASSGNLKYHIEFSNPAVGTGSDPTPTVSSTVSVPVTGANQMLRFVIDISPGMVALDEVEAMIVREGDTDGVLGDGDYINGWMEVAVLP